MTKRGCIIRRGYKRGGDNIRFPGIAATVIVKATVIFIHSIILILRWKKEEPQKY